MRTSGGSSPNKPKNVSNSRSSGVRRAGNINSGRGTPPKTRRTSRQGNSNNTGGGAESASDGKVTGGAPVPEVAPHEVVGDSIENGSSVGNSAVQSTGSGNSEKEVGRGTGNKSKKGKKKPQSKEEKLRKRAEKRSNPMYLKPSRIVCAVFLGILFSLMMSGIVYKLYMAYIKYPSQEEVNIEKTGIYCINGWIGDIQSLVGTGDEGYISQEVVYANGDEDKIAFFKKMAETVNYTPAKVVAKNVYGNDMISSHTDEKVYIDSYIEEGEEVELSYIDYSALEIDRQKVKELLDEEDLRVGDVDYPNKLISVFCKYMVGLDEEDIPTKSEEKYVPNMVKNKNGTYSMTEDEDTYIDKLLYSSEDLRDLMERFSAVAGGVDKKNPKWVKWSKLPKKKKAKVKEPEKLGTLTPTKKWAKWNKLSKKEKAKADEPIKYNWKEVMSTDWCGVYYLQNERVEVDENGNKIKAPITAEVGDGTFDNPAGMNTPVLTYVFNSEKNKKGKKVVRKRPIKVQMIEYGVSEEAVKWFESKDEKNRGIDLDSEVQYCYYIMKVTNMSSKKLRIRDNTVLCDNNANIGSRTGVVYGLQDSVLLDPDESGIIETWGRSTELNKKYVIWGKDFERREVPIWFRVLAGNIDDPSEDKGVRLNKSREGQSEDDIDSVSDDSSGYDDMESDLDDTDGV